MLMKSLLLITGLFLLSVSCSHPPTGDAVQSEKIIEDITNQYNVFLNLNLGQHANSEIQFCDGYFAGVNWNMFILSGHKKYEELAIESLSAIEQTYQDSLAWCAGHQLMAGFGNGIKVTQSDSYRKHLIEAVKTQTHDFDPETGRFYLNDFNRTFGFESIMKLESLFYAARLTADPVYYNIAIKHAEIILDSFFENGSGMDPQTDSFQVNSLMVYSCALLYRETGAIKYLRMAESILSDIPNQWNDSEIRVSDENRVPNSHENNVDITSLALLASALYDLCLSNDNQGSYAEKANEIIGVLSTRNYFDYDYLPDTRDQSFFIKEYFFLEALIKRQKLMESIT